MKKNNLVFMLLCLAFFSTKAQTISDSVLVDGNYRKFHFTKPNPSIKYTDLMFIIHGSNGDGLQMRKGVMASSKVEQNANESNTIIFYPDAYKRYWNECRKASPAEANLLNINEQDFFEAMINYANKNLGINKKNVFVSGMSGGGHMTYKLSMTMPGTFKAAAAFVANLPDSTNMDCVMSNAKPIPMMIINGTADPINPYNGGVVDLGAIKMGAVLSTEKTLTYWANLAKYKGVPSKEILQDAKPNNAENIEKYTYKKKHHPEIVLYKVNGMKHSFPADIDGLVEALMFFQRQK